MDPSRIEYIYRGDVLVLNFLTERFELNEAAMLENLIFNKLKDRSGKIVLNLSNAEYINSTGVSILVRISAEKKLKLSSLRPALVAIMKAIGIFEFLKSYPTIHDACRAFGPE